MYRCHENDQDIPRSASQWGTSRKIRNRRSISLRTSQITIIRIRIIRKGVRIVIIGIRLIIIRKVIIVDKNQKVFEDQLIKNRHLHLC